MDLTPPPPKAGLYFQFITPAYNDEISTIDKKKKGKACIIY